MKGGLWSKAMGLSIAPAMALHGWIILDKPIGLGSTQAVGAVKRALREAGEPKSKVGHGGALDPLASGVLPIALGEATKLAGRMLDAAKTYDFTIRFGEQTDSLDLEGQVIATSAVRPGAEAIEAILPRFTGAIEQVPPAFSALKVDGERAYDLARAGKEVELKSRQVTIHSLSVVAAGRDEATFSATVSKGTYIRSLARDIALALGTVGHVAMLRRVRAGPFSLEQAISLDKLAEIAKARALTRTVLPLEAGLDDIPGLPVTPEQARLLRHGQQLFGTPASGSHQSDTLMVPSPGLLLARDGEVPVALVESDGNTIKVVRGFNL
jgi:tRNA pseudouridine55 synthase